MNDDSFEKIQKSSNLWAESGYSYDTTNENLVNVSNNIPTIINMNNELIIVNINNSDALQKNRGGDWPLHTTTKTKLPWE